MRHARARKHPRRRANRSRLDGIHLLRRLVRLIKAFALRSIADLRQIPPYAPSCDYLLFDTPCTGFGGSGTAFDWDLLRHYEGSTPFLLSGGIRPESLEALKRFRHPRWAGIDLNSGFETAPAVKDAPKLKAFIEAVKRNTDSPQRTLTDFILSS